LGLGDPFDANQKPSSALEDKDQNAAGETG